MATQPPPQETMAEYLARMLRQGSPGDQPQPQALAGPETLAGYASRLFQQSAGHAAPPPPPGFPYRSAGTTSPYDAGLDAGGEAPFPSPPRGVATPDNVQPVITAGLSKETLPKFDTDTYNFLGEGGWKTRPYAPVASPLADPHAMLPDPAHILYSTPNSGGMRAFDPDPANGVQAYAGGDFMGAQGRPGGGALSMNALPITGKTALGRPEFDWAGRVANPEAFSAYTDANRDAAIAADRAKAETLAKDPWAEKRAEADIWMKSQLDLQRGIQQMLQEGLGTELAGVEKAVDRDMPGLSPTDRAAEIKRRVGEITDRYQAIFGNKGAASTVHITGSPIVAKG